MPYPIKIQPPRGLFLFRRGCRRPPPGRRTIYNLLQDLPCRRRKQIITLIPPKQAKPLSANPQNQVLALLSHPKTGKAPFCKSFKTKRLPPPPTPKQAKPLSANPQNQALALLSHPKAGKAPFCKSSKPSACPFCPPQSRQSPFLQSFKNKHLPLLPTQKQVKTLRLHKSLSGK